MPENPYQSPRELAQQDAIRPGSSSQDWLLSQAILAFVFFLFGSVDSDPERARMLGAWSLAASLPIQMIMLCFVIARGQQESLPRPIYQVRAGLSLCLLLASFLGAAWMM